MASLKDYNQATLTANSDVESIYSSTSKALSGTDSSSQFRSFIQSAISSSDFVGINANGLDEMNSAIDTYCNSITDILSNMDAAAAPDDTFRGKYSSAVTEFTTSIKNSCTAQVTSLLAFKKDLNAVVTAMQEHDTTVTGSLSDDASSINGAASVNSN